MQAQEQQAKNENAPADDEDMVDDVDVDDEDVEEDLMDDQGDTEKDNDD